MDGVFVMQAMAVASIAIGCGGVAFGVSCMAFSMAQMGPVPWAAWLPTSGPRLEPEVLVVIKREAVRV